MNEIFKLLGDKKALDIIMLLSRGELCVCDIQTTTGYAQSCISKRLKKLRGLKLVVARTEVKWVYYDLNKEEFKKEELKYIKNILELEINKKENKHLLEKIESSSECC